MDGPQTKERWAARYATVLADDPGCSVLSLTSLGMTQLSRPRAEPLRSRVVALWKDRFNGATEIELPRGDEAIAISLSTRYEQVLAKRPDATVILLLPPSPEVQAAVDSYRAWVENNRRLRLKREARQRSYRGR